MHNATAAADATAAAGIADTTADSAVVADATAAAGVADATADSAVVAAAYIKQIFKTQG